MAEEAAPTPALNDEDRSKDAFYDQVAALANAMIAAHGSEFAMGTLVLAEGSGKEFGSTPISTQ